jgi:HNH endonuclease
MAEPCIENEQFASAVLPDRYERGLRSPSVPLDRETRYALYLMGGKKCVWCGRPILFSEMEAEHLIPKSLGGDELVRVLALHGLPADYDLESLRNRAPSCRGCNGSKSARIPPDQPIIAMMLESAAMRAPLVERRARSRIRRRDAEEAAVVVGQCLQHEPDDEVRALLRQLAEDIDRALAEPAEDDSVTLELHPALALLWNPGGQWRLLETLGSRAAVVTDGQRAGVVGTDITFLCGHCGNYGPWNGTRCLTCGQMSDPWD